MTTEVETANVKAVQEPGYADVWSVQTETGETVARLTVGADAAAWAKRIADALNADVRNATLRVLAALDALDRGCREPGFRGFENGHGEEVGTALQDARENLAALIGHVPAVEEPAVQ